MEYTLNIHGKLFDLSEKPIVMGILNATPDSFWEGSRMQTEKQIAERAEQILLEGGQIIDVGAFSTRPGGVFVTEEEELKRMKNALSIIRKTHKDAVISIDTYRPMVAKMAVEEYGAGIINDVSEGGITGLEGVLLNNKEDVPSIFVMAGQLKVPYILMSVKNNINDMVLAFTKEIALLRQCGVKDIVLDPGFGFGKTVEENYCILNDLEKLHELDLPLLVGVSRKRMIFQLLNETPETSLNGTTAVNAIALMKGASVLRVHDVKQAVEVCKIVKQTIG